MICRRWSHCCLPATHRLFDIYGCSSVCLFVSPVPDIPPENTWKSTLSPKKLLPALDVFLQRWVDVVLPLLLQQQQQQLHQDAIWPSLIKMLIHFNKRQVINCNYVSSEGDGGRAGVQRAREPGADSLTVTPPPPLHLRLV